MRRNQNEKEEIKKKIEKEEVRNTRTKNHNRKDKERWSEQTLKYNC